MNRFSLLLLLSVLVMHGHAQNFISIDLKANKLLFDSKRNKIYATINPLDANYANLLVQINPGTGTIENSVFVGSDPGVMAMTRDSDYVYIGLKGSSFVKRVSLQTFSVDLTISLGAGSGGSMVAEDLVTVKLSNNLVVVARKYTGVSPTHAGVAAYLNGSKLPLETPDHTGSNEIEAATDSNFVVGFNTESTESGIRKMSVDSVNGVSLLSTTTNMNLDYGFELKNDLVYSSYGKVFDPFTSPPSLAGTCPANNAPSKTCVEADPGLNTIYYCYINNHLVIRRVHLQTFAFMSDSNIVGTYPNTFQIPETQDLIRFGTAGLGLIIGEGYFFGQQQKRVILLQHNVFVGTGETLLSSAKVQVYPNPCSGTLHMTGEGIHSVTLQNSLGQPILSRHYDTEGSVSIHLQEVSIPPGVYFVSIRQKTGEPIVRKLIYEP